jgi:hypothetical protein
MRRRPGAPKGSDPVIRELREVNRRLEELLILECARMNVSKANVRMIIGCGMNRITSVWKRLGVKAEGRPHS